MRLTEHRHKDAIRTIGCACVFGLLSCSWDRPAQPLAQCLTISSASESGWGVDACLTAHVKEGEREAYLRLLQPSGIRWLREREPNSQLAQLKAAGYRVSAFLGDLHARQDRAGDALPEDLLAVFNGAKALEESGDARNVDAWEMVGEPDVGYCTDLPDRLAAFQKAVYLGIKAGARTENAVSVARTPIVLMGALALPPGPWLERAVKNGLLDYTDAYNFHYYGNADDLAGVIAAHRTIAKRAAAPLAPALPLWITECGMDAVSTADFLNPARRQMQAAFAISTAKQALAAKEVSVFMPFNLVHHDDPFAMTLSSNRTLPAWDAYAAFTRQHPWPKRVLSAPPVEPDPIVIQWMPDIGSALAHKVSGTYRFLQRRPMHGKLRIYNFSSRGAQGKLRAEVPRVFFKPRSFPFPDSVEISVPAEGRFDVPVTFSPPASGYAREDCEFEFVDSAGAKSKVSFGLETWPELKNFTENALSVRRLPNWKLRFPQFPDYVAGDISGPWRTINGLHAASAEADRGTEFWTDRPSLDPLMPTMAFAAVDGIPVKGFLRVQMDQPMALGRSVRVDFVDTDGQRFCIWENLGQSYYVKASEVWLNVKDMQIYIWGHCTKEPTFHPARVKEVQLWFYRKTPGERMRVQLSWMTPRALDSRAVMANESMLQDRVMPMMGN